MAVYYYINGKKVEYGTPEYYEERRIRQERRDARIEARNDAAAEEGKYVVGGGHGFILGSDGYVPGTGASPGTGTYMSQADFEAAYKANPYNNWQEGDPIPQLNKNGSDWEQDNEWYGANPDYSPLDRDNPDSPTAPSGGPGATPGGMGPPTVKPIGGNTDWGNPWEPTDPGGWYTGIQGGAAPAGVSPIGSGSGGGGGDGPTYEGIPGQTGDWWDDYVQESGGAGTGGMFGELEGIPIPGFRTENPNEFSPYGEPVSRMSDQKNFGGLPRSTGPWALPGGYYRGVDPFGEPPSFYNSGFPYPGVGPATETGGQQPQTQWPFTPIGDSPYPSAGTPTTPKPIQPPSDIPVGGTDPLAKSPRPPGTVGGDGTDKYDDYKAWLLGKSPTDKPTTGDPIDPLDPGGGAGSGGGKDTGLKDQHSTDPMYQYIQSMYLKKLLVDGGGE